MITEELKFCCMRLITVDGSSEEIFFKIHNDGISELLNMKINREYNLFCKVIVLTNHCERFPD